MKRQIIFLAIILFAGMTMVSCNRQHNTPRTVSLNNMNDSINYAIGHANGDGIRNFLLHSVEDEDEAIQAFFDALDKAFKSDAEPDEMYQLGMQIGGMFRQMEESGLMGDSELRFNAQLVKEGLQHGVTGASDWPLDDAQDFIEMTMMQIREARAGFDFEMNEARIDSLNYAFGLVYYGDIIRTHYLSDEDEADERLKTLMKGVKAGMKLNPEHAELIGLGTNIGESLRAQRDGGLFGSSSLTVDFTLIRQGLVNGIFGFDRQMSANEAQMYVNTTMQRLQEIENEELSRTNRQEGETFLAENKTKQGVVTTESGLQYRVITEGRGRRPTLTDRVRVHYHGTLIDGTVFDSSVLRGESIAFPVSGVISGWTEALQLMPVGSKWVLYIPQELAYGSHGAGGLIPPYSALIFEVELLGIE